MASRASLCRGQVNPGEKGLSSPPDSPMSSQRLQVLALDAQGLSQDQCPALG